MRKITSISICTFVLLLLLSACGGNRHFNVSVNVPSIGTQEMTVVYETESGDRVVRRMPAMEGKFEFEGSCADTTLVEIFNAKKAFWGAFKIVNGMDVELRERGDSLFLEGVNDAVMRVFEPDSLSHWPQFGELELVITYDSVATFEPEGVWFFTCSSAERSATVLDSIRKYAKMDSAKVRDVYVSADMGQWRLISNRDSSTWVKGMLPDAPLALGGILTATPCLVEVDTAGVVLRVQRLP